METDIRVTEKGEIRKGLFHNSLLLQKIPCHLVALLKITLFLTSHSNFGLFYGVYHLLTRDQFICIITHLILHYLVFELSKKNLETSKTLCSIHIALCNVSSINVGTHTTNTWILISFGFKV